MTMPTGPDSGADGRVPSRDGIDRASQTDDHHVRNHAVARRTQGQRRATTRALILSAAREAFLEHGYQHVSLEDIVSRAGLTRGALYHQFDDKAGVFQEVVKQETQAMQGRLLTSLAQIGDPLDRLGAAFRFYLDNMTDRRVLRLVHVDYPSMMGPVRATVESQWMGYVTGLLQEAIDRGLMRIIPVAEAARLVVAFYREAVVGIVYAEDSARMRADMEVATDALMDGLRARART